MKIHYLCFSKCQRKFYKYQALSFNKTRSKNKVLSKEKIQPSHPWEWTSIPSKFICAPNESFQGFSLQKILTLMIMFFMHFKLKRYISIYSKRLFLFFAFLFFSILRTITDVELENYCKTHLMMNTLLWNYIRTANNHCYVDSLWVSMERKGFRSKCVMKKITQRHDRWNTESRLISSCRLFVYRTKSPNTSLKRDYDLQSALYQICLSINQLSKQGPWCELKGVKDPGLIMEV